MENIGFIVALVIAGLVVVVLAKTAVIVPQQNAFVVERLGQPFVNGAQAANGGKDTECAAARCLQF